jgi:hypothetical protein
LGQIVKTWVKVLGLNDPYKRYIESGLKAGMGQIVIYFLLIKKMLYICIAAAPMLQGCDFFGVTI